MENLAWTRVYMGQRKGAEELLAKVIETRKDVLGEEHEDTLRSINTLAFI
jgi:hypothetical protein